MGIGGLGTGRGGEGKRSWDDGADGVRSGDFDHLLARHIKHV